MLASHFHLTNMFHIDPNLTQKATDQAVNILDTNYKAADLPKEVDDNCEYLTDADKSKLPKLLTK